MLLVPWPLVMVPPLTNQLQLVAPVIDAEAVLFVLLQTAAAVVRVSAGEIAACVVALVVKEQPLSAVMISVTVTSPSWPVKLSAPCDGQLVSWVKVAGPVTLQAYVSL